MTEINKQEALRWVKAGCPRVWFKAKTSFCSEWATTDTPNFHSCLTYITDDSQAKLRMLQIDEPETKFEMWNDAYQKWGNIKPTWDINTKYRVKETKFELKYDNPIYVGNITSLPICYTKDKKEGKIRTNEQQRQLAFKSQLRQMRLGALIDQCGGQEEWVEGKENWYLYKYNNKWDITYSSLFFSPEKIYCTRETVKKACKILDKGEYNLEVER